MTLACRTVLATAKIQRASSRLSLELSSYCSTRLFSTNLSSSDTLLQRLLREPSSRVKSVLDAQDDVANCGSEISWETLVTSLRSSSSPKKAQQVLEWRLENMVDENESDHDRYSDLISLCGKVPDLSLAMRVFRAMEAQGVKPTASVLNSLIQACFSSHNITTAFSLFEVMARSESHKPTSDTYTIFISAFAGLGDAHSTEAWYSAKKSAGFSVDLHTYESLIYGCVKSKNFGSAERYYKEMTMLGIIPTVLIVENMLEALYKRSFNKAWEYLSQVLDYGWEINEKIVEKFSKWCCETRNVKEMEELLTKLHKSNPVPDVLSKVHSGIIRMYTMSDRLDDIEYSVGRMLKQGLSFECSEDVEKIICSYFRQEAYERLDLLLDHIKGYYTPSKSTYDLLIAGYRRAGLHEKLNAVMECVKYSSG